MLPAVERWLLQALKRVPARMPANVNFLCPPCMAGTLKQRSALTGSGACLLGRAAWEPTVVNLGHVYRKQRRWAEAIEAFQQALGLCPGQAGTYAALGYTLHLQARARTLR